MSETNIDNVETSTQLDDVPVNAGQTEQELLDAVMKNSLFTQGDEPLPTEEIPEVDPTETTEEEDPVVEEVDNEETEEVEETEEEEVPAEDAVEETATQEVETFNLDELDDFSVNVKIDGKETAVNISDLVKGYSTEQSLSKKGRELGEARKEIDKEKAEKLEEINKIAGAASALLSTDEQATAKEYHEIEAKIEKARADGDTFEVGELKDKREQVQKKYWEARQKKEGLLKAVQDQQAKAAEESWNQQIEYFQKEIPNLIPDFDEKVAQSVRDFALEEGISPETLNQITDPKIVKFVDDYRRLKQNVNKGVAKRKSVPTKKAVPQKKAAPAATKAADAAKMVKARAFKEDASAEDQMDFLRQHASKSLNL